MKVSILVGPLLASGAFLIIYPVIGASLAPRTTLPEKRTSSSHSSGSSSTSATGPHGPAWHQHPMWNHPALHEGAPLWPSSTTSSHHSHTQHGSHTPTHAHSLERGAMFGEGHRSREGRSSAGKAPSHVSSPTHSEGATTASTAHHSDQKQHQTQTHEHSIGGRLIRFHADGSFQAAKSPLKLGRPKGLKDAQKRRSRQKSRDSKKE